METIVDQLRKRLREKCIEFAFIKKDGSVRIAHGTTNMDLIDPSFRPKGYVKSSTSTTSKPSVVAYFDTDKYSWRSLSINTEFVYGYEEPIED